MPFKIGIDEFPPFAPNLNMYFSARAGLDAVRTNGAEDTDRAVLYAARLAQTEARKALAATIDSYVFGILSRAMSEPPMPPTRAPKRRKGRRKRR